MSNGTTILITGATDGLGRGLAHRLAADGSTLILHGRNPERLTQAADEIRDTHGIDRPKTVLADLAELAQVRHLASQVRDAAERLDVLVNNAGIGAGEPDGRNRRTSIDGYELRFAVNYLAGFLLPTTGPSSPAAPAGRWAYGAFQISAVKATGSRSATAPTTVASSPGTTRPDAWSAWPRTRPNRTPTYSAGSRSAQTRPRCSPPRVRWPARTSATRSGSTTSQTAPYRSVCPGSR